MAVVINKESGLVENLPDATSALQTGTHEVPLYNPQGEFVSVPYEQASDALQQGYKQPNSQQLTQMHEQGKYGTTEQQLKTAAEGAASTATFGLSTAAERALGVNPKDIQKRKEVNPVSHGIGEAAGIVGSLMTGVGEGALLERGAAALVPESLGKVGGVAARSALSNMGFQAGSEASDMFMNDPNSVETAIAHVGLAGVVGGAFGSVPALWSAGPGKKLSTVLGALKDRSGGIPEELKVGTGISIPPEVQAGLSDNEYAQRAFNAAREGSSSSDKKVQQAYNSFQENMIKAAGEALGKTPEDVDHIIGRNVSEYDTGKEVKDQLVKSFKETAEPVQKAYNDIAEKFKTVPVGEELKAEIANNVTNKINEMGLNKSSAAEDALKIAQGVLKDLPKQANADDLRLLAQNLQAKDPSQYGVVKALKSILNTARESALTTGIADKAPDLISSFDNAKSGYAGIKSMIEDLNSRLHVGKSGGPDSFLSNLSEMSPEVVLRRLGPKGDKDLQLLMEQSFPEVSAAVKSHELNKVIQSSGKNGTLDLRKLLNNVERMGEDLRNYAIPQDVQKKLGYMKQLTDRVPTSASFLEKIADKVWSKVPNAASGIIGLLMKVTHNPVADFIIGNTVAHLGSEAAGGARLALLKYLGSASETSAEGFKAAAQMANAVSKGEQKLNTSVKNVFSTGSKVIPFPKSSAVEALDKQVKLVADNDPEKQDNMMKVGGHTGHYLPEHGAALAMLGAKNMQYLASLRPVEKAVSPLEPDPMPDSTQKAKYNKALQIAQQPLVILNSVKDGSLTLEDRNHLETMYPALHVRMCQKMFDEIAVKSNNGKTLPYATKMGISALLGTPLDASMSPQTIMSTQTRAPASQQPQEPNSQSRSRVSSKLDKMPGAYATPQQSRQMQRSQGK